MTRQEFDKEIQRVSNEYMMASKDMNEKEELYSQSLYAYFTARSKATALYKQWLDMVERLRTEKFDG